jgi:hypothetical protein
MLLQVPHLSAQRPSTAHVCLCGVDRENQQSPSSEIYSTKKAFNLGTHSVMIVQGSLQLNESVTQFKRRASAPILVH